VPAALPHDTQRAPSLFSKHMLEYLVVQAQVRHQLLQTAILVEHTVQLLRIGDLHSAVPAAPSVERRLRDSVLTAQVGHNPPCFRLLQNPNDLSLSKQTFPHVVLLAPFAFGRTLFLTGVELGGQVSFKCVLKKSVDVQCVTRCSEEAKMAHGRHSAALRLCAHPARQLGSAVVKRTNRFVHRVGAPLASFVLHLAPCGLGLHMALILLC